MDFISCICVSQGKGNLQFKATRRHLIASTETKNFAMPKRMYHVKLYYLSKMK